MSATPRALADAVTTILRAAELPDPEPVERVRAAFEVIAAADPGAPPQGVSAGKWLGAVSDAQSVAARYAPLSRGEELFNVPPWRLDPWPRAILERLEELADAWELAANLTDRKRGQKSSKIAVAIGVLAEHPDWTNKRIAEAADCTPAYLSRNRQFKAARKAIRDAGKSALKYSGE